jgi:hypothetical protein
MVNGSVNFTPRRRAPEFYVNSIVFLFTFVAHLPLLISTFPYNGAYSITKFTISKLDRLWSTTIFVTRQKKSLPLLDISGKPRSEGYGTPEPARRAIHNPALTVIQGLLLG